MAIDFKEDSKIDFQADQGDSSLVDKTLATTAILGGGGALYGAKKFADPFLKRIPVEKEFEQFRKQLGLRKGVSPELITRTIREKVPALRAETSASAQAIRQQGRVAASALKRQLNDFDNSVLNTSVENLATTVKEGYPQFLSNAYNTYEQGLTSAENALLNKSISINGKDFGNSVLERTINYAKGKGYLDEQTRSLVKLQKSLGQGELGLVKAKGYITNLAAEGNVPNDVIRILRENWGKYLEGVAPPDVRGSLEELNAQYKPFAEVRNKMSTIIDPRTGQADTAKLYNYLKSYATKQQDVGVSRVMEILQKDIPAVSKQFAELSRVKTQRAGLAQAPRQAELQTQLKIDALYKEASAKMEAARAWSQKASESQSILEGLNKKVAGRVGMAKGAAKVGLAAAGAKALHLFSGALPAISVLPEAVDVYTNPRYKDISNEEAFSQWLKENVYANEGAL